tara:strand:+ start:838 stop:1764 length:927 start_codon:yes stop_codon:yes gene_type:complete
MIYIKEIKHFIPRSIINDNFNFAKKFNITKEFINKKIGIRKTYYKKSNVETSDLCVNAFRKLQYPKKKFDCVIVCTQNPDKNGIPHTSAIVHSKLKLNNNCACFDISLGCSGYIYSLSIAKSLMISNDFKNCLIFTCDPYSKIINDMDKNTSLLFSDAATATVLINSKIRYNLFTPIEFLFGNDTLNHLSLNNNQEKLFMNGRHIFNFAAEKVPLQINYILKKNKLNVANIDYFLFHQGSLAIIKYLKNKLKINDNQIVSNINKYGNTVSSTIPLLMEEIDEKKQNSKIIMCGFGVGLSYATCFLRNY